MAWKKPSWVQKAQTATSNAVKPVAQAVQKAIPAPPPAPKVIQNIQKAADKVGNVVKPAAQAVAKEVGYVVNPIAGEVALRAKEIARNPDVVKAGNAIANNVINPITTSAPVKAVQQAAQQAADTTKQAPAKALQAIQSAVKPPTAPLKSENNGIQEVMPYFTKILPNAVGDVVKGTGRATAGVLTADADKIASGAGMVGRGAWNAAKNGVMGALPFFNAATTTTEPTMGGGRSGGAATTAIPTGEDTDDVMPTPPPPPPKSDGRPIPPTPLSTNTGSYLTDQRPKSKLASVKMPKKYKARKK